MKALQKTNELEDIIKKLDLLLVEGHFISRSVLNEYNKIKDGFDKEKDGYLHRIEGKLEDWANRVIVALERLPNKQPVFHFTKRNVSPIHISGIPKKVSDLQMAADNYLNQLEDVILHLDDKLTMTMRREIAEIEHGADILYQIEYKQHLREVRLNNLVIANPNFATENDEFMSYIITHPNEALNVEDIKKELNLEFNKPISHVVRDLGFTGDIKKIFFPGISKDKVMFMNPISKKYAIDNDLPALNLSKIGR